MKVMVSDMNHEMECLKQELGKLAESEALNDLQQKNFIEEIQKVTSDQNLQLSDYLIGWLCGFL